MPTERRDGPSSIGPTHFDPEVADDLGKHMERAPGEPPLTMHPPHPIAGEAEVAIVALLEDFARALTTREGQRSGLNRSAAARDAKNSAADTIREFLIPKVRAALRAAAPAPVGEPTLARIRQDVRNMEPVTRERVLATIAEAERLSSPVGETPGAAEGRAEADRVLRKLLWLCHGHTHLYGDDGELQCNECPLDFKRASAEEIDRVFYATGLRRYAASVGAAPAASGAREMLPVAVEAELDRLEEAYKRGAPTDSRAHRRAIEALYRSASVPSPVAPPGEEEPR